MSQERNAFRLAVAVAGLVPVGAGLAGAILGADAFTSSAQAPPDVSLDSHVRYLSGLLLGVGVAFWATLKRPEDFTARYRLLAAIVFVGGLARLAGLLDRGEPNLAMRLALVMELCVTPALALWQARLAKVARRGPNAAHLPPR